VVLFTFDFSTPTATIGTGSPVIVVQSYIHSVNIDRSLRPEPSRKLSRPYVTRRGQSSLHEPGSVDCY